MSKNRPKTLLLFPPHVFPIAPYMSTPLLKAYAKEMGYYVNQIDVNTGYFEYILSVKYLELTATALKSAMERLDNEAQLTTDRLYRLRLIVSAKGDAEYATQNIDEAKVILRDSNKFYNHKSYTWAMDIIFIALRAISRRFFPSRMSLDGFRSKYSPFSPDDIVRFAGAFEENPYYEYYNYLLPLLELEQYAVVGISVAFPDQMLPAWSLAKLIKEKNSYLSICLGGNVLTRIGSSIKDSSKFFDCIDAVFIGEGEVPFVRYIEYVTGSDKAVTKGISGAIIKEEGRLHYTGATVSLDAKSLPTPDYTGLDLEKYFAPHPVFSLLSSKGCSYGKCSFCDHHVNYSSVSSRPPSSVVEDISKLHDKHKASYFSFVDEDMSPMHAEALADAINKKIPKDIKWIGYASYRKDWTKQRCRTLHDSGCRELLFGFESASRRILKAMKKPHTPEVALEVTKNLNFASIASRVNVIIGYPGETRKDAQESLDFFIKFREHFDVQGTFIAFHPFLLVKNSPLTKSITGEKIKIDDTDEPFRLHYKYDISKCQTYVDLDNVLDCESAYRAASYFASTLSSAYTKSSLPINRIHRFLYIASDDNTLSSGALSSETTDGSKPTASTSIGDEINFEYVSISMTRHEIMRLEETARIYKRFYNSYEQWSNFRSTDFLVADRFVSEKLLSASSGKKDTVYLRMYYTEVSGKIVALNKKLPIENL